MKNILNCVFITDEGYILPTITALASLNENLHDLTSCVVHVVAIDLSNDSQVALSEISDKYGNVIVHATSSGSHFSELSNSSHVSTAALFKFKLPDILSDLDEALYLDGDIIITKDLVRFFEDVDIGNHYVAAVKDIKVMKKRKVNPLEALGANHRDYFNSGVMLLNLKKMREDGLVNELIDFKKNRRSTFMDQDAFNYCFKGNVLYLPPVINYLTFGFSSFSNEELKYFYKDSDFFGKKDLHQKVVIYHFASKWKPWNFWLWRYTSLFKQYYRKTPYSEITLSLDYSVQIKLFVLYFLKMLAPNMLKRAFEPSGKRLSVINALLKSIEELIKGLAPTFIHVIVQKIRTRLKSKLKR